MSSYSRQIQTVEKIRKNNASNDLRTNWRHQVTEKVSPAEKTLSTPTLCDRAVFIRLTNWRLWRCDALFVVLFEVSTSFLFARCCKHCEKKGEHFYPSGVVCSEHMPALTQTLPLFLSDSRRQVPGSRWRTKTHLTRVKRRPLWSAAVRYV